MSETDYLRQEGFVFDRVLFVCLSVRQSENSESNDQTCVKFLPEVCLGPRENLDILMPYRDILLFWKYPQLYTISCRYFLAIYKH